MKKYCLKYSDLVINTLIAVDEREHRRVIDSKDALSYKKQIEKKAMESSISFTFQNDLQSFNKSIGNYLILQKDKYMILPWVDKREMSLKFNKNIPNDILQIMHSDEVHSNLINRTDDEKKLFKNIEDDATDFYYEQIEEEIMEIENHKHKCVSKLIKIKSIRDNK